MNREEREFETIADAGLVVDGAQVVFDDLLGGLEAQRDFAILAALDDERDDAHLLGRKTVANAGADHIFFRRVGNLELGRSPGVSGSHAADALDERLAGDVAEDDAAEALLQISCWRPRCFRQ